MRIIHLSDIHVWKYSYNPVKLLSKRAVGVLELLAGRARKFRLERLEAVVERVRSIERDHTLITGDLTTTALRAEFRQARAELGPLLADPARVTILPGNHDRYTGRAFRERYFEEFFGAFAPATEYPWLRRLDDETGILGLDPTRSHISARGMLPTGQLEGARALAADPEVCPRRLIVACHYPVAAPPNYERILEPKRMRNAGEVRSWLATLGPHVYCCGHVHAAWAFVPPELPNHLSLNAGAPLLRDPTGFHLPGFLQIDLDGDAVTVTHHAWTGVDWLPVPLLETAAFFRPAAAPA